MRYIYIFLSLCVLLSSCKKTNTEATSAKETTDSNLNLEKGDEKQLLNQITAIISQHFADKPNKVEVWDHVRVNESIHLFAYNRYDADVTYKGVAYFKNNELRYCNDNAFFCTDCNNAKVQVLELISEENNPLKLRISITWGPSTGGVYSEYYFSYNENSNDFILDYASENGWENPIIGEDGSEKLTSYRNSYSYNFSKTIKLADFNAENLGEENSYKHLTYNFDSSNPLNKIEKDIRKEFDNGIGEDFNYVFNENDIQALLDTYPIDNKNIESFNNIAYYLGEMGLLGLSETLLKQILDVFPDRMVAHFNLGDVYVKEGKTSDALSEYQKYVTMMNEKRLQNKIPERVISYIKQH